MKTKWKVVTIPLDGIKSDREILFLLVNVNDIGEAMQKAQMAFDSIIAHKQQTESYLGVCFENVNITLHGFYEKPLSEKTGSLQKKLKLS